MSALPYTEDSLLLADHRRLPVGQLGWKSAHAGNYDIIGREWLISCLGYFLPCNTTIIRERTLTGNQSMRKQEVIKFLDAHKASLSERFGVTDLALFGSTARDTAGEGSDVDILVSFDGPATSKRYFGVQFYLEDLLGCPVDLVTDKALRPELRPYIEREAIHV